MGTQLEYFICLGITLRILCV